MSSIVEAASNSASGSDGLDWPAVLGRAWIGGGGACCTALGSGWMMVEPASDPENGSGVPAEAATSGVRAHGSRALDGGVGGIGSRGVSWPESPMGSLDASAGVCGVSAGGSMFAGGAAG
jgi:hypothetical protein